MIKEVKSNGIVGIMGLEKGLSNKKRGEVFRKVSPTTCNLISNVILMQNAYPNVIIYVHK